MSDRHSHSDPREPLIIEWYRVDATRRMVRVLIPSMLMMTFGGCVAVIASTGRIDLGQVLRTWAWRVPMTVSGIALIAYAGFRAIYGLQKLLADDAYLTLRTDALIFHDDPTHLEINWDDLEEIRWDPATNALIVRTFAGEETPIERQFSGIEGHALAKRVEHIRKRALFGIAQ